jgi:dienelactone hydrolase
MQTETVTYEAEGLHTVSHVYYDEQRVGRRPGVLVFPEAFGLGDHAKFRAERLAGLAMAPWPATSMAMGRSCTTAMRRWD